MGGVVSGWTFLALLQGHLDTRSFAAPAKVMGGVCLAPPPGIGEGGCPAAHPAGGSPRPGPEGGVHWRRAAGDAPAAAARAAPARGLLDVPPGAPLHQEGAPPPAWMGPTAAKRLESVIWAALWGAFQFSPSLLLRQVKVDYDWLALLSPCQALPPK